MTNTFFSASMICTAAERQAWAATRSGREGRADAGGS